MAVGFAGSPVGVVAPWLAPAIRGQRPVMPPTAPPVVGGSPYPSCRLALSRESETDWTWTGTQVWSGQDNWQPIDGPGGIRVNGAIPVPATERRFTLWLRTTGGQVLVYGNGTVVDTSGGTSAYVDVAVDWPNPVLVNGSANPHTPGYRKRLARSIAPSLNYLATRGGEVSNGTGAFDFRVVTPRLSPGWHSFTLLVSKSLAASTTHFGAANPRAGSDNDGWIAFGVVELPGTDRLPGLLSNLAVSSNLGHTVLVPGPNLTLGAPNIGSLPIAGGAATEAEGAYSVGSTTFVTMDSVKPVGVSNNRFTQRFLLDRPRPVLVLVGLTCASVAVGDVAYIDLRVDGVRLGGVNGLAQRGAEVSSGTGSIHLEYITRWLSAGWHQVELMGRVSANSTSFNFAGASAGTVHEGWMRMHCIGLG